MSGVTRILNAIEQGDAKAADEPLPSVYDEPRLLAAQRLSREKPDQTLQAAALVHEAYIRLVGSEAQNWNSRTHFLVADAEAMHRILGYNTRRRQWPRGGGGQQKVDLDDVELAIKEPSDEPAALDKTLAKLQRTDKVKADLVELRYFAGLTFEQADELLEISTTMAKRHWAYVRALLHRELSQSRHIVCPQDRDPSKRKGRICSFLRKSQDLPKILVQSRSKSRIT